MVVLVISGVAALAASTMASVSYSPPFPTAAVGYARPMIGIRVVTTGGDRIARAAITVDGVTYAARQDGNLLYYQPEEPLAPGRHTASVYVEFTGPYYPLEQSWSFTVLDGALPELPAATPLQQSVLQEVNRYRALADLRPLRLDRRLNAAASAHARYFVINPTEGLAAHNEQFGRPGYTGASAGERGAFFGYPYSHYYEDMHFLTDHRRAVKEWVDSVYHRLPITDYNVVDLGYGYAEKDGRVTNVLNIATTGAYSAVSEEEIARYADRGAALEVADRTAPDDLPPGTVVYPIPGQRDVPTRWDGNEEPDPYRLFPGARAAGYPITVQFLRPLVEDSSLTQATLEDETGARVPLWILTPANDQHIRPHIALLPKQDLKPGTRYRVTVRGTVRLHGGPTVPFARTWWFTTAGKPESVSSQPDIRVLLNGSPLVADVPPAIKNGRTMLPFRAIFEALGAEVAWDPDRRDVTATLNGHQVFLKIDNDRALVDGREKLLDAAPFIASGRTLVPVRFAAEALGMRVSWDAATRTVHLLTP